MRGLERTVANAVGRSAAFAGAGWSVVAPMPPAWGMSRLVRGESEEVRITLQPGGAGPFIEVRSARKGREDRVGWFALDTPAAEIVAFAAGAVK